MRGLQATKNITFSVRKVVAQAGGQSRLEAVRELDVIHEVRGVDHQCCTLHQSLVWRQAELQGRAAATEEPSNPIYSCRRCGALDAELQWTEVSNLQTAATVYKQ